MEGALKQGGIQFLAAVQLVIHDMHIGIVEAMTVNVHAGVGRAAADAVLPPVGRDGAEVRALDKLLPVVRMHAGKDVFAVQGQRQDDVFVFKENAGFVVSLSLIEALPGYGVLYRLGVGDAVVVGCLHGLCL